MTLILNILKKQDSDRFKTSTFELQKIPHYALAKQKLFSISSNVILVGSFDRVIDGSIKCN